MKKLVLLLVLPLFINSCFSKTSTENKVPQKVESAPIKEIKSNNEILVGKKLLITYSNIENKDGLLFYQGLEVSNKDTGATFDSFPMFRIYEVQGITGDDTFDILVKEFGANLKIQYYVDKDGSVKHKSECKWLTKKDNTNIENIMTMYQEGIDGETVSGKIHQLALQGDVGTYNYLLKPTKKQKKYHRFSDGAGSYQNTIKTIKQFEKHGCTWK